VIDVSGHVIAGAKITLVSDRTSESRSTISTETGTFNIAAVQPDTYSLRVEQKGFKVYQSKGLTVAANARVSLGEITLQIGEVTETVSVTAEGAQVQTDSSEHPLFFRPRS